MHTKIATAIVLSLAFASQQRGWVSSVTTSADASVGTVQFHVRGTNPCGAVMLDYGDGTAAVTHPINQLPATIPYEYTKVGQYTVRARGMGNCDGDIFTRVNIPRVKTLLGRNNRYETNNRYAEMDQNNDGVITRAEWRGTAQAFNLADWNNDGRLSGDEVRTGATPPDQFAGMDRNRDGVITRAEWTGTAQGFDLADWNNDGRLSGDEVRAGARQQYEWTDAAFRRFDRNRDNYISGTEWRYETDDFAQVDRNRDDRVSLAEFLDGESAIGVLTPGNRGRGRGRGRGVDQAVTVVVTNRQVWIDSGIDVRAGETLNITATGRVQFSRKVEDVTGPNGQSAITRPRAPMPNMPVSALVARVGNSAPFFVGARGNALSAPQNGRLYLGINDDILTDNSGEFRVTVTVNPGR